MTLLDLLDKFPPFLCRIVARTKHGMGALTDAEIGRRCGMHRAQIGRISKLRSWKSVPLGTVSKFSEACGVNLLHPRRHIEYLKRYKKRAWFGREKIVGKLLQVD